MTAFVSSVSYVSRAGWAGEWWGPEVGCGLCGVTSADWGAGLLRRKRVLQIPHGNLGSFSWEIVFKDLENIT